MVMTTLAEIEAAADALPPDQKEQLLLFLASRLRAQQGTPPALRKFTREQMQSWIDQDEADMRQFRDSK